MRSLGTGGQWPEQLDPLNVSRVHGVDHAKVYGQLAPSPSSATSPGAVEYAMKVPHFPTPWEPVYASSNWAINCFVNWRFWPMEAQLHCPSQPTRPAGER